MKRIDNVKMFLLLETARLWAVSFAYAIQVPKIKGRGATVKSHPLNNAFKHGVTSMAVSDAVCVI